MTHSPRRRSPLAWASAPPASGSVEGCSHSTLESPRATCVHAAHRLPSECRTRTREPHPSTPRILRVASKVSAQAGAACSRRRRQRDAISPRVWVSCSLPATRATQRTQRTGPRTRAFSHALNFAAHTHACLIDLYKATRRALRPQAQHESNLPTCHMHMHVHAHVMLLGGPRAPSLTVCGSTLAKRPLQLRQSGLRSPCAESDRADEAPTSY